MRRILTWGTCTLAVGMCVLFLLVGCEREDETTKAAEQQAALDAARRDGMREGDAAREAENAKATEQQAALDAARRDGMREGMSEADAAREAENAKAAEAQRIAEANRIIDESKRKAEAEEAAAEAERLAAAKKAEIEEAVEPPAALAAFQTELEKGMAQISALQVSLNAIGENAAGDLSEYFETFEKELEATESLAESLRERNEDMQTRGTAYFDLWEKQLADMKTESVLDLAKKRREELAADYGAVMSTTQLLGDAYKFYMGQLEEIREALDDDLAEETVNELAPKISKAAEQAEATRGRMATLVEKLQKVAALYAGT